MPIPVDKYASHEEYETARREFIKGAEGAVPNVYLDHKGIPTVGIGESLVIYNKIDGEWKVEENRLKDLVDRTGMTEDQYKSMKKTLDEMADNLNQHLANDETKKVNEQLLNGNQDLNDVNLTDQQMEDIYNKMVDRDFEDSVKRKLGSEWYDYYKDSEQMLSLVSRAYNSPSLITKELIDALKRGDAKRAEEILRKGDNPKRRNKEADLFGPGKYNIPKSRSKRPNGAGVTKRDRDAYNQAKKQQVVVRRDPLVVDLDGDGIETCSVRDGAYFDHNGDGFSEKTGWVSGDDGLLVLDRNGDGIINSGGELFGDQTVLKNGRKAANGFQALAELDDNKDGKFDINDAAYSQLRVWRDSDGDGYSLPDELIPLSDLGISSIHVDSSIANTTGPEGNTQTRIATYEKTDGTTATIANVNFQQDTMDTQAGDFFFRTC